MCSTNERWVLRAGDQRTLDDQAYALGMEQDALMESAGTNAARWIHERLRPHRVAVVAGPGGNGGDGLVVARRLHEKGIDVQTAMLTRPTECSPATQRMVGRLEDAGATPVRPMSDPAIEEWIARADCIVDALFGSGLRRSLTGDAACIVELMNMSKAKTISLDVPSGLTSDDGAVIGMAIDAFVTLAMAFLKPAHLLYPAAAYCGNTALVDVEYPESVLRTAEPWARVCECTGIKHRLPIRRPDGHKGTFGRVLIVAGSIGMSGAAILCGRGALRAGAGLVSLAVPASLASTVDTSLPEAITIPVPDRDGRLDRIDDARLQRAMESADVLAIGPGLSQEPETLNVIRALVDRFGGPIVLDADGHYALGGQGGALPRLAGRAVLTPHPGEFGMLVGALAEDVDRSRRDHAGSFAAKHGVVLVLKGRPTAIGLPDGDIYLNPTGNDGLATGGSGDVLTGLIAGFIAGGSSLADAALIGAYVHGLASEIYGRDRAPRSLIPSDLVELVPSALREVEKCN